MERRSTTATRIGSVIIAIGMMGSAQAQSALGTIAASCLTLPVSRQHNLTVTTAIARGNSIMIAAGVDSGAATDISISDSKGNAYPGVLGRQGGAINATSILLRAPLQKALAIGDIVTVRYGAINAGQNSCVGIYGFSQLAASGQILEAAGSASARATSSLSITGQAASRSQPNLVFAAFTTTGSMGSVSAPAPTAVLPTLCSASGTLCMVAAWRAVSAAGYPTIALAASSTNDWSGVLAALYADSIFFSGFD